ncbi:glycosyltransferase [Hungatella hathewayi]|uniref:glycosyltransferase n=1 Tax=Hungatella hathewayi TaxID=154046 RepID=UPI002A7F6858|nr:glycosyltransferase [Hungatella hathewayi]
MSVIMNYYRHIDRNEVQFDFLHFVACEDSYIEEIRALGGRIYCIDKPGSSFQSVKQLDLFFRLHAEEYTWLHNHEVYLTFLLRPFAKRYGLEKFIVHCHATKYSDKTLHAVRNRILCLPIRFMKVDRFACSEAAGKFLYGEKMLKAGKVFIMHNAIDCEKFRFRPELRERLRKEMGLEGKFVIGHVGRFERQKNHEFLIEVFAEVKKSIPQAVLLLIGDGSLKERIKSKVVEADLKTSVIFLRQRNDVNEMLHVMDVFVLPSYYEGLPVSCIEAQANGLPCVISGTITKEVCINENVSVCNLENPPCVWSELLKHLTNQTISQRILRQDSILKNGYCLKSESAILRKKYLGGYNG